MSTAIIRLPDDTAIDTDNPFPVTLQTKLMTDATGLNSRLRVDVGQTGFFAGREFKTFKEFSITSGSSYVLKFVSPVNFILSGMDFTLITGEVKASIYEGGTEGGTFSDTLPIIPRNTMTERPTPYYESSASLVGGGTLSGGTQLDLIWSKVTDNANKATSSDTDLAAERGFASGTYYLVMSALANSTGVFHARWEERP